MDHSPEERARRYRAALLLVHELHLRGYQRLRILPDIYATGSWRCHIAPVTLFSAEHGAVLIDEAWSGPLVAHYTSSSEAEYFGWPDAGHTTPSGLARRFVERFPEIVAAGKGRDWAYVGWYIEMLHLTYPTRLPYVYSEFEGPCPYIAMMTVGGDRSAVHVPRPPPGEAPDSARTKVLEDRRSVP
jgi:hypothetical protein